MSLIARTYFDAVSRLLFALGVVNLIVACASNPEFSRPSILHPKWRIQLLLEGGIAGQALTIDVDGATKTARFKDARLGVEGKRELSSEEMSWLERGMVEESGRSFERNAPDCFDCISVRLEVQKGDLLASRRYEDASLIDPVDQKLINYLRAMWDAQRSAK